MPRCAVKVALVQQEAVRGFSLLLGLVAAVALALPDTALACQPAPPPPPLPPLLYGETEDEYSARSELLRRAEHEHQETARRAARLKWETELWESSDRILAVEVLEAPRIRKQSTKGRDHEIILRSLTAARGDKARPRFVVRYETEFSICGYYGAEYFRGVAAGDVLVLHATDGKLSGKTINTKAH